MFLDFLGRDRRPETLSRRDWDRFIRARRAGRIGPSGQPVSDQTIHGDLTFLMAVLNWAARSRDERGRLLLDRNPLKGLRKAVEKNPVRVVVTDEEFRALLEMSRQVGWRFHVALVLAHPHGPARPAGAQSCPGRAARGDSGGGGRRWRWLEARMARDGGGGPLVHRRMRSRRLPRPSRRSVDDGGPATGTGAGRPSGSSRMAGGRRAVHRVGFPRARKSSLCCSVKLNLPRYVECHITGQVQGSRRPARAGLRLPPECPHLLQTGRRSNRPSRPAPRLRGGRCVPPSSSRRRQPRRRGAHPMPSPHR